MKRNAVLIFSAILLAGIILFFQPMECSNLLDDHGISTITIQKIGIRDGQPWIDPISYSNLTPEQQNRLFQLCRQYTYRRTFGTLFSDGTIADGGDSVGYLFGEDGSIIAISSKGTIAIGNQTFRMAHADQWMAQVLELLEETPAEPET